MTTRRVWSEAECEALVADYLSMLKTEQRGEQMNKAAHVRELQPQLNGRTKGAIEDKHENVSAIANQLGFPSINGYKPQGNYQRLLFHVVERRFFSDTGLAAILAERFTAEASQPDVTPFSKRRANPPKPMKGKLRSDLVSAGESIRKLEWLQIEAANRSLGLAGEVWVIEYERERLTRAGKSNLADNVEHVSETVGDGLGFDIRSYELEGTDRFIEVKTTANPKETPFYVSRNELRVSRLKENAYYLYRVFRFRSNPQFFSLCGAIDGCCLLDPVQYSARVK